jgi:transcriptional regulator with XRE-family HTH domain
MIGKRLKALRAERNMSQYDLANAAGVSQGLIWQLEANRKNPGLKTLLRLAQALSVSPEELLPVVSKNKPEAHE